MKIILRLRSELAAFIKHHALETLVAISRQRSSHDKKYWKVFQALLCFLVVRGGDLIREK